ncbi:MAG: hypothetical protein HXY25_09760, partial [Alphaproteobacteria bacterium]|nr:hypothetical protein [Alphaproteobacteria bacterium]
LEGRVHLLGGAAGGTRLETLTDHLVLEEGGWRRAAALPTPRQGSGAASVAGRLVVIGGGTGAGVFSLFTDLSAVDILEP